MLDDQVLFPNSLRAVIIIEVCACILYNMVYSMRVSVCTREAQHIKVRRGTIGEKGLVKNKSHVHGELCSVRCVRTEM